MASAHSKLSAQGRVSVPEEVRRKLSLEPGAVLEWTEEDGRFVVRRAEGYSSEDIHRALFGSQPPKARTLEELKEGIRHHVRSKHASR